ncbi:MAG: hypothetical protein KBS53_01310 [Bacteroidales bacterium]|nr:hypothetical protein [Candidatus Hennigimonas equi]
MIKFIGEYPAKVDDKGRVVFPSALKAQMQEGNGPVDLRFVIKKDLWEPCLEMYTLAEWERQSEEINSKINPLNRDHSAFWREYTRHRCIAEPEAKLGRMAIPKTLLESIGAGRELVFCGCDHKIEIWGREQFENSSLSSEQFISLTESLSSK